MADTDNIVMFPENQNRSIDPALLLALNNNNGFGGMNNPLWMMFMYPFIFPFMNMFGGFGGYNNGMFGGNGGFLANQLNNDTGRDLILQAINGRADALGQLAAISNSNIDSVRDNIAIMNTKLSELGGQFGMTGLQVINAVQSGNATLGRQLCECCCENRLLTTEQSYQAQIRTLEQTNQLGSQADRNFNSTLNSIADLKTTMVKEFCDARERDMQEKINSLTAENATLKTTLGSNAQTAQIGVMINALQNELNQIKAAQPQTITLPLNNYQAVPSLLANAGADFIASYWANRLYGATQTPTTTTPTTTTAA